MPIQHMIKHVQKKQTLVIRHCRIECAMGRYNIVHESDENNDD